MLVKFNELVELLTEAEANVITVNNDKIVIRAEIGVTTTTYTIVQNYSKVIIEWKGNLGILGNHKFAVEYCKLPQKLDSLKIE